MEIDKRISELLYLKECVVIPGLGAFVSRYTPARIREESQTIIPPSKKFLFNRMLIQDDGELTAYLARYSGIDIDSARKYVEEFVGRLHSGLSSRGHYYIRSVGELKYARTGELIFNPDEGVNFLTDAFGLSSIQFSRVKEVKEHPLAKRALHRDLNKPLSNRNHKVLSNTDRRKAAKRVAIAIPLLIAISLLPINSRNGSKKMHNTAGFFSMPSLPVNDLATDQTVGDESSEVISPEGLKQSDRNDDGAFERDSYAIVAGSFSSRENAEVLHSRLDSKGYYNEIWEASNGFFRVVVQAHEKMSDAQQAAAALKEELDGLDFWILR